MKKLFILGAGQLGKAILSLIKEKKNYRVIGFVDPYSKKSKYDGIKIFKSEKILLNKKEKINLVLGVGDIMLRKKLIKTFSGNKFNFLSIIFDEKALNKNIKIEKGCIVMPNTFILNNTKIGKFCLIGTSVTILHDVTIGKNCVIGGGTLIGANTFLDDEILVGVGSVFSSNKKKIGSNSIVCAGSVVHKSIKKNSKVIGNPLKFLPN